MRGNFAQAAAGLACLILFNGAELRADEPIWNSRPLRHWVDVLQTGDTAARIEAARGLAEMAVAVRAHAAVDLTQVAPADATLVEACGRVLGRDADARVRQAAAACLVQAGPASHAVEPALLRALSDGDAMVRLFSATAVGQLGQTSVAVPVLLAGLTHQDPAVRAEAAGLLAQAAPADAAVVAPLISALADDQAHVRQAAAEALGQIGQPARPAIQPLWRLIRDPDEAVRESALRAIRRIRD